MINVSFVLVPVIFWDRRIDSEIVKTTLPMLDIQREKFEIRDRLKEAGLSDKEIKERLTSELKPFKPAFINGKRVKELEPLPLGEPIKNKKKRSVTSVQY
jgi:hypothetical protein